MRKFLVLSLILVMSFSAVAFAQATFEDKVDVAIKISPFVKFAIPHELQLSLKPGSASGFATAKGYITANFPYELVISSTAMSELEQINNWFLFEGYLETATNSFSIRPGFSKNLQANPGEQEFSLTVKVGEGVKDEWYELPAGEYLSKVYLTVFAQ